MHSGKQFVIENPLHISLQKRQGMVGGNQNTSRSSKSTPRPFSVIIPPKIFSLLWFKIRTIKMERSSDCSTVFSACTIQLNDKHYDVKMICREVKQKRGVSNKTRHGNLHLKHALLCVYVFKQVCVYTVCISKQRIRGKWVQLAMSFRAFSLSSKKRSSLPDRIILSSGLFWFLFD